MGDILGEGSQGKVREALDSETLRRVAIKIVNLRQLRKVRNAEEGLRRELAIHRRLRHRHVIEMLDCFTLDEKQKTYVVLERIAGGSLQSVLDSTPEGVLCEGMARRFARQLFEGLEYIHSQGVVHRDIKPANLLVAMDGMLKMADFGSAEELSRFDASDVCSKSKGSPAFQPPEVAAGDASFSGFKVDVWAAGVSIFFVTTGQVPFAGSSLMHLFENIAKGEFDIPARIASDAPLVSLLRALLAVAPAQRLAVKEALGMPWLSAAEQVRWTTADRELIASAVPDSARSLTVLQSVARMYGEEPPLGIERRGTDQTSESDDSGPRRCANGARALQSLFDDPTT
jgi:serine/threonine-protein kinase 11